MFRLIRKSDKKDTHKKLFLLLIDPDKQSPEVSALKAESAIKIGVDYILVGGSKIYSGSVEKTVASIKSRIDSNIILFPGKDNPEVSLTKNAYGYLSPVLLNGISPTKLVDWDKAAGKLNKSLEIKKIPFHYILVESGNLTEAHKVFSSMNIKVIPHHFSEASNIDYDYINTINYSFTYIDTGSGAKRTVPIHIIKEIKKRTQSPIIVGGGITTPKLAKEKIFAGADGIVVGTVFEKNWDEDLLRQMITAINN